MTASLFTRSANGLQAWPDDRTTIGIRAKSRVSVGKNQMTGDAFIQVEEGEIAGPAGPVCLYIPRGGSVVIEVAE